MNLDTSRQETVDLLIQHLAVNQAAATAERIYRTIFGSQIAMLKLLNTRGGTAARGGLEAVYDVAKSRSPDQYGTYSFQQWINYSLSQGLLSTNDSEQFSITIDGIEFLKWMTDVAVTEDKPL